MNDQSIIDAIESAKRNEKRRQEVTFYFFINP